MKLTTVMRIISVILTTLGMIMGVAALGGTDPKPVLVGLALTFIGLFVAIMAAVLRFGEYDD